MGGGGEGGLGEGGWGEMEKMLESDDVKVFFFFFFERF